VQKSRQRLDQRVEVGSGLTPGLGGAKPRPYEPGWAPALAEGRVSDEDAPHDGILLRPLPVEDKFLEAIELFEPAARRELLTLLTSSDVVWAELIGQLLERRTPLAELLMDLEEDRAARAVVVGLLRESLR
jgi:hypothetical protein